MKIVVRHDLPIAEALEKVLDGPAVVDASTKDEALRELEDASVFVVNSSNWVDEYLEVLSRGDWVQSTSAGFETFPIDEFERRGIVFATGSGNHGPPVADHAFALALSLTRGIRSFLERQRHREWDRSLGTELIDLEGRTLTVVGLGDIGEHVARRGRAFGMDVYGTRRKPDDYTGCLSADRVRAAQAITDLLPETDLLILTVPLTDETYHLIDEDELLALPDSAVLVNVSRGPVIDTEALLTALDTDQISGVGLDVFQTEPLPESSSLWERDEVVLTPHIGGRSSSFVPQFVDLFETNRARFSDGDDLENQIT